MAHKDYLIRRNQTFSFRIRVPLRLQPTIGRLELRRSLGARSYPDARATAQCLAWVTLRLFTKIENNMDKLTKGDIDKLLGDWHQRTLDQDL